MIAGWVKARTSPTEISIDLRECNLDPRGYVGEDVIRVRARRQDDPNAAWSEYIFSWQVRAALHFLTSCATVA